MSYVAERVVVGSVLCYKVKNLWNVVRLRDWNMNSIFSEVLFKSESVDEIAEFCRVVNDCNW
jgi:hypothetical protein